MTPGDKRIIEKSENRLVKKIREYEKQFSRNQYHGARKPGQTIVPGTIPVMVSAPHAVSQLREGQVKKADKYTGTLALLLHELTGCHIIYATGTGVDPNYESFEGNSYQATLIEYVKQNRIPVLIDLHGASAERPFAIELGTAPEQDGNKETNPSLKGHDFIGKLLQYAFEYVFGGLAGAPADIWTNRLFDAGGQNTVTKSVSSRSDTAAIQVEINGKFRDPDNPSYILSLLEGLRIAIEILAKVRWQSPYIDVFKLRRSKDPMPQDKVEFSLAGSPVFNGEIVEVCSFNGNYEPVHVRETANDPACIYFTNRLIHNVYRRDWELNGGCLPYFNLFRQKAAGAKPFLEGAPVLVTGRQESAFAFPIGITKALKLDKVFLSSQLYKRMQPYSGDNLFVAYNRFTDSRLYFDFEKEIDYQDNPPVSPPEKVMLPKYFKQLLGYNSVPFKRVRREELDHFPAALRDKLLARIDEIAAAVASGHPLAGKPIDGLILNKNEDYDHAVGRIRDRGTADFVETKVKRIAKLAGLCYSPVDRTAFYSLNEACDADMRAELAAAFTGAGLYDTVEILVIPKRKNQRSALSVVRNRVDRIIEWGLTKIIGKSEFLLTTVWTNETDDKNFIARLSPNIMSLLGITDNDKVVIKYGEKNITVRVLANPELGDYEIGIPANARALLNMYSVNDVVVVARDMRHTFKRNSQAQTIAILGTVLAVFQVIQQLWVGVLLCIIFIPLIIYFSLNEERIKVK